MTLEEYPMPLMTLANVWTWISMVKGGVVRGLEEVLM